jgi:hypothetical protein
MSGWPEELTRRRWSTRDIDFGQRRNPKAANFLQVSPNLEWSHRNHQHGRRVIRPSGAQVSRAEWRGGYIDC